MLKGELLKLNPQWVLSVLFGFQNHHCAASEAEIFSREILSGVTRATGFVYESIRALWVYSHWVE